MDPTPTSVARQKEEAGKAKAALLARVAGAEIEPESSPYKRAVGAFAAIMRCARNFFGLECRLGAQEFGPGVFRSIALGNLFSMRMNCCRAVKINIRI